MTQQRAKEIEALKERNRKAEEAKARKEAAQKRAIEEQAERNAAMRRERAQRKKEKEEALLREKRYQAMLFKALQHANLLFFLTSAALPLQARCPRSACGEPQPQAKGPISPTEAAEEQRTLEADCQSKCHTSYESNNKQLCMAK